MDKTEKEKNIAKNDIQIPARFRSQGLGARLFGEISGTEPLSPATLKGGRWIEKADGDSYRGRSEITAAVSSVEYRPSTATVARISPFCPLFDLFTSFCFSRLSLGQCRLGKVSATASCVLQTRSSQCQGMDTTFYEDSGMKVMRGMKRPMTLDLDGAAAKGSKKPRANNLLTSPDLNMLKLGSPELEKLIIAHNSGFPGDNWKTTNPCMYPKSDEYTRDFNDALSSLQQVTSSSNNLNMYQPQMQPDLQNLVNVSNCNGMMQQQIPCSTTAAIDSYGGYHHQQQPLSSINMNCNPMVSSSSMNNNNTNCYDPNNGGYFEPVVNIKEEPQTVPCMGLSPPPHSPIDMEDQERLKLERKRLRNRIAASKCRRRKLERIARLEDKVANLKSENADLVNHVARLRDCICQLKQQVMDHVRSGCEILVSSTYPTDL